MNDATARTGQRVETPSPPVEQEHIQRVLLGNPETPGKM